MKDYIIQSKITRNYPDPVYYQTKGIKYHVCIVDIHELYKSAPDLVLEANPRDHSESKLSNSRVVRAIRDEYLNETNKFHQKNSGITIIADNVEELGNGKIKFTVDEEHGGITNGGTTYRTLMNAVSDVRNEDINKLPQHQFVKIEIRSKVPTEWISDISGGLNTHAQVQDTALLNLGGELNFIKEVLDTKPYGKKIAYKQNEEGEVNTEEFRHKVVLPVDHVVAENIDDKQVVNVNINDTKNFQKGFDIGSKTAELFNSYIELAETVLWNGPLGVFENDSFGKVILEG